MCESGEIFTTFKEERHRITKKMIQDHQIETYEHLMKYIQKYYGLPYELELVDEDKGTLLTAKSSLFPQGIFLSVQVLSKHITNVNANDVPIQDLPYDIFFKQRDINISKA